MTARVFSWDWKAQPDLAAIAAAVTGVAARPLPAVTACCTALTGS
jgi:hypothetical protein